MTTQLTQVTVMSPITLRLAFSGPLAPTNALFTRNNYIVQTRFGPDQPVATLMTEIIDASTLKVTLFDAMLTRGLYQISVTNLQDAQFAPVSTTPIFFEGVGLPQKAFDIKRHMPSEAFSTAYKTTMGSLLEAMGATYDSLVGDYGSALVEAQQALSLRTATGEDLSIIGQNYGVTRPDYAVTNDALFRILIPIYATQPKGTLSTLTQVLTAIIGPAATAGWVISDVTPGNPIVEIPHDSLLAPQSGQGATGGPDDFTTYLHADSSVDSANTFPGDYLTATANLPDSTEQGDVVMIYSTIQAIDEAFTTLAPAGVALQVVIT